jgi:hypothetical protein
MNSQRRTILSPGLIAKLSMLGATIGLSRSDGELEEILAELSALPPDLIVQTSGEIVLAAQLWWRPRQFFSLESFLAESLSEQKLLKKNPDYAWLLLFHTSGYVRQAALNSIHTPPTSPFFFAALAWRLNDWVEPVRQAATRCAQRVLGLTRADIAASSALYLLDRRLIWGRWNDETNVLDAVFGREDIVAILAAYLQKQATGPLATRFRHVLRYPNIDMHLPRLAADAVQPSVRSLAYQCLLAGKAVWPVGFDWMWIDKVYGLQRRVPKLATRGIQTNLPYAELIREAVYDNSSAVKRVAADALIRDRGQLPDEESLIAHLAKDRSRAVRSRADYMLRHPTSRQAS